MTLWVLRFTSSNTDKFNTLVGGDHNAQRRQEAFPAASKKAAMLGQITKANGVSAVAKAKENDAQQQQSSR